MKMQKLIIALLLIKFSIMTRVLQSNSFVTCTKAGECQRVDKVNLQLGWVPKIPTKNYQEIFSTSQKDIISINPFNNAVNLNFIRGSNRFTCADGVYECFNSCCNQGFCSDPSNVCTVALKSSDAIVYASCIVYCLIAIVYWILFGYIGAKYAKKKAHVTINNNDKEMRNEEFLDKSKAMSGLDNFDDDFNTGRASPDKKDKTEISGFGVFNNQQNNKPEERNTVIASDPHILGVPKGKRVLKAQNSNEEVNKPSFLQTKAGNLEDLFYKSEGKKSENGSPSKHHDEFEIREL